jgi:hypothetical protein
MIKLEELTKEDIGRWVYYSDGFKMEKGRIKSWNEEFIFVVYKCNEEWERFMEFTGCATNPEDLGFTTLEEFEKIFKT